MVPSDRVPALLKRTHESSSHVGAARTLRLFKQWFHTTWSDDELRKTLQPIVDKCPCRSCKPGDIRDRGIYLTLPSGHGSVTPSPARRARRNAPMLEHEPGHPNCRTPHCGTDTPAT